jgi:proline iminopeptidase
MNNIYKNGNKTRKRKNIQKDIYYNTKFFPKSKPFYKGFVKVSDIHTIAYFCHGNKNGKPVLVVHGGPGAGTSPTMARFFNPKKYYIILVDQRGCGESIPTGEIKNNTTHHLINDFEKIRLLLEIKKWQIFGGSWGSTLSIAYAQKHPEIVSELIVRGIFSGTQIELNSFNEGLISSNFFPEAWNAYKNEIPKDEQHDLMKAYGLRIMGKYGSKIKDRAQLAWCIWESSCAHLFPESQALIKKELKKNKMYIPFSIIEYHYFSNNLFFPSQGYIFEPNNIKKIKNIPMEIVHGRYDMICKNETAHILHKLCPKSNLHITVAGHSAYDIETLNKLVQMTNKYV